MKAEQQEVTGTLRDGTEVIIRPLLPSDSELERAFIMGLSPQSRRFRFLYTMSAPSPQLLKQLTNLDEATEAAFIALSAEGDSRREVGEARMIAVGDGRAEFAVAVSDEWQHKGLGVLLAKQVIAAARARGIGKLFSIDASANHAMQELAAYLGFERTTNPQDATEVIHTLHLRHGEC